MPSNARQLITSAAALLPCLLMALGCSQVDPQTEQAQQALQKLTTRRASPEQIEEATEQLRKIGDPAIPVLEEAFFSGNQAGSTEIAIALGGLGPGAMAALTKALESGDLAMVHAALAGLRFQETRAVPVLVDALSVVSSKYHSNILGSLGGFSQRERDLVAEVIYWTILSFGDFPRLRVGL